MDLCLRTESQPFKAVCLRGKKSFIYKSFPFQRNTLKFLVHNDSFPHKLLSGEQNTLFHTFMRWGPSYPLQPRLAPHRACRHCRQPQFYLLLSLLLAHLDRSPGREAHSRLSSPGYHYHIQPSSSLLLHWGGKKKMHPAVFWQGVLRGWAAWHTWQQSPPASPAGRHRFPLCGGKSREKPAPSLTPAV